MPAKQVVGALLLCGFLAGASPSWGDTCIWNGASGCNGSCTASYQTCFYDGAQSCKCVGVAPAVPAVSPFGMLILIVGTASIGIWSARRFNGEPIARLSRH